MDISELTLVQVQELCAKDEQFRLAFEAWWNDLKRRYNIVPLHHWSRSVDYFRGLRPRVHRSHIIMQQYSAAFTALTEAIESRYTDGGYGDPLEQLLAYEDQFDTSAFTAEVTQYITAN